jgi:hypothetical protein
VSPKIVVDRSCSRKKPGRREMEREMATAAEKSGGGEAEFQHQAGCTPPKPTPTESLTHQLQNVCALEPYTFTPCSFPLWPEQWPVALHLPRCSGSTRSGTTLSRPQRQTYCNYRYVLLRFRQNFLYQRVDFKLLL